MGTVLFLEQSTLCKLPLLSEAIEVNVVGYFKAFLIKSPDNECSNYHPVYVYIRATLCKHNPPA